MARKRRAAEEDPGYNYMDTYGDLITLVLTFFVLLYSFSSIDVSKWKQLVETFTGAPPTAQISTFDPLNPTEKQSEFDVGLVNRRKDQKKKDEEAKLLKELKEQFQNMSPEQVEVLTTQELQLREQFDNLFKRITDYIDLNELNSSLNAQKEGNKIFLVAMDGILFDSGRATIKDENAEKILLEVSGLLLDSVDLIANLRIEGHTDNVPINNAYFKDNWDLSVMRSTNVLRFVVDRGRYPVDKISAAGYGEMHPIASNATKEGQASNRRVTFLIERKAVDGKS